MKKRVFFTILLSVLSLGLAYGAGELHAIARAEIRTATGKTEKEETKSETEENETEAEGTEAEETETGTEGSKEEETESEAVSGKKKKKAEEESKGAEEDEGAQAEAETSASTGKGKNGKTKEDADEANADGKDASVKETGKKQKEEAKFDGSLRIKDGMLQPMLRYSDPRDPDYTNEDSDILRFCVYVETDHDTDNDGMADLVKAFVQVPRSAVEGKYQAAVIYDPTPYSAGTCVENEEGASALYVEEAFDYDTLYQRGKKREPSDEMDTMDAALLAVPEKDWNYMVPVSGEIGYAAATLYDYYLVRGFAVVEACGIGTYGSEGFELCGTDLERDSHKCVVEWLTGERKAYTDRTQDIEIKADWSNGNVAMTGCSYGGTLPYEVATTGVEGLKTIIPYAGIASWYDYTNSQGVPIIFDVNYTDYLAAFNCGGTYLDNDWTVPNEAYGSWLWQIAQDEAATNGDYAPVWEGLDYSDDYQKLNCSALIVQGLNDFNVTTRQADLMYRAFQKAGMPVKLVLHQDGHNDLYSYMVGEEPWYEIQNKWLSHYLYDVENGIEDMAELTVQDNIDGSFTSYEHWQDLETEELNVSYRGDVTEVTSVGLAESISGSEEDGEGQDALRFEDMEAYYLGLQDANAAVYEIEVPEDMTICGVPELSLRLSTNNADKDGMMITAVLVDTAEEGEKFPAFMLKDRLGPCVPKKSIGEIEVGAGLPAEELYEHVQSSTAAKCFSFGWTDLQNPGCGYASSEYTKAADPIEDGKYYDYTFYMLPTVYTVAPGHKLKLILTTWDPYRAFLDEGFSMGMSLPERMAEYNYSYVVDNASIKLRVPVQ